MVSDKGGRKGFVTKSRQRVYRALPKHLGKKIRAMIANRGDTHAERSAMAKKAARTRKRRGRKR